MVLADSDLRVSSEMAWLDILKHRCLVIVGGEVGWVVVCGHSTTITDTSKKDVGFVHHLLYESQYGVRKVESNVSTPGIFTGTTVEDDRFYIYKVKPWLNGVRVSGVNTYEEALRQQTADVLAGK